MEKERGMFRILIADLLTPMKPGVFSLDQYNVLGDIYTCYDRITVARAAVSVPYNPIKDTSYELQAKRKASDVHVARPDPITFIEVKTK